MNKQKEYLIKKDCQLLVYLMDELKFKRNEAKKLLSFKQVFVNEKVVSQFDYVLKENDKLLISNYAIQTKLNQQLQIIYEDEAFLAINKPAGLLSIGTSKDKENTAYHLVREYLNHKHEKVFILHRLDKDTSGVLVFVKKEKLKEQLQADWNKLVLSRGYYAVVEGKIKPSSQTITNYLKENTTGLVYVSDGGKKAITTYQTIKTNRKYSLLDIKIATGRKNQIRVTLADLGYPVVGDEKYGNKKSVIKRLALHAYELKFVNPQNNKEYHFKTKIPSEFAGLIEVR